MIRRDDSICVILHGGAGALSEKHASKKLPGLQNALDAAWGALCAGESGEQAVAAALSIMEGDEHFNAGFGSYPSSDGVVLMDIGLMRGTGDFMSLLNVRKLKYPSLVALDMFSQGQALMSVWTNQLMQRVEESSGLLKERYGFVENPDDMIAPFVRELVAEKGVFEVESSTFSMGTVGCVVRDTFGKLHAGTSTGGVRLKHNGRVGDSPIIGSGVFADDDIGAISTTGHGESFLKAMFSGFVLAEMRTMQRRNKKVFQKSPAKLKKILAQEFRRMEKLTDGGRGGAIVVPKYGPPQYEFNSFMMSVGMRMGTTQKINQEEVFISLRNGKKLTPESTTNH